MSITFEWSVTSMHTFQNLGEHANVANAVDLELVLVQDGEVNKPIYRSTVYLLPPEPGAPFIDINNLSKETVVKWALESLGDQEVRRQLARAEIIKLYKEGNQPILVATLPWETSDPISEIKPENKMDPSFAPSIPGEE